MELRPWSKFEQNRTLWSKILTFDPEGQRSYIKAFFKDDYLWERRILLQQEEEEQQVHS